MNVIINKEEQNTQAQNVQFSDQTEQWVYAIDNQLDDVNPTADTNDATLANFFSRPVKIKTQDWSVNGAFHTVINPWSLYFGDKRVVNRICNFNLLRAKLHVRILVNGNGFHYGRALASYRPLHLHDSFPGWRSAIPTDIIRASQRMHVWIDPTKSQGGTLCLPYVYYKNALSIPLEEWNGMGELTIGSVTTLGHANAGTDKVTVSVFAWAEDVELSIPTSSEPGALVPQAGEMGSKDEYPNGTISGPANTIARAAGKLSSIPTIGPYAKATELAANAVGGVAEAFGYSRPVNTHDIDAYKPTFVGNMANTNCVDTSQKLSLDQKQELTIDPRACGLGSGDEMSIVSIAQRESYLTQFLWTEASPVETLLWNCKVQPHLFDKLSTEIITTPMSYVSMPFKHWRGTIRFRFQIVASAFHKGRIKVVYDPYYLSSNEYNVQYTRIIDLANERDFTVDIQWGQEYSFLENLDTFSTVPFSSTVLGSPSHGSTNGIIAIYTVTDLTAPGATAADLPVLVSVSTGDDFEVANPDFGGLAGFSTFEPQMGELEPYLPQSGEMDQADADYTQEESKPMAAIAHTDVAAPLSKADHTLDVYFGDPVTSIRQLVKRYCPYTTFATPSVADDGSMVFNTSDFPMYRGYGGATAIHGATTPVDPTPFTFALNTFLNWYTPLFLCRRGSIRWKYIYSTNCSHPYDGMMCVSRLAIAATHVALPLPVYTGTSVSERVVAGMNSISGWALSGGAATQTAVNPVLEVEIPMQQNIRFLFGRYRYLNNGLLGSTMHQLIAPQCKAANGHAIVNSYCAAGEDFSLSFFQCTPTLYQQVDPAPSSSV